MTLQQVAEGLQIPSEDVYRIGSIPDDVPSTTALKDLEEIVEVSTLRELLGDYLAGEVTTLVEVESAPPVSTASEAAPQNSSNIPHAGDGTGPTPLPPRQILLAEEIKGQMTLRDVSDQCAVNFDELLVALNLPSNTDPNIQLKTLIQDGTLDEVTEVQAVVATLQEASGIP